ncbi:histidine kinase N-terminal 7TM domain-containing protein [Salinibaculum rarum]|uniref:sensor histidine kinase n=1 Tax=Salinibaculum rarum TaxID=3058903 RepID=UPI0026604928|nr:histidine kinase N-terminal 7TM domain-containing protein [Salinibaculum sp. KK48]
MAAVPGSTAQTLYIVAFGVATVACLGSLVRARHVEDRATRYGLIGLLAGSGGWAASHAGVFVLPTADLKIASYSVGLVLGFSTVFSWLYFCSAYSGRSLHRNRTLRWAGLALYLAVVAVKVTNPLHHQYFVADVVQTNSGVFVDIQQQAFHWAATGLAYALAAVGLFMLFERFANAGYETRPLVALTGLTALPALFDIVGFSSSVIPNVIYAPLGVAVFALGVLFVYEDRFLAVQLTGDVDEAFVFLADDGTIRDYNDAAMALFPDLSGARGNTAETVDGLGMVTGQEGDILDVTIDGQPRYYMVTSTTFRLGQADIGEVVMFSDVTSIERQRRELQRHNEQLEEFASGIRHELRNSLQVIRSRVAAAGSALDEGRVDMAQESLGAASERTGRMSRTVSDLATLAQYGQTVGDLSTVSFREAVEAAWRQTETASLTLTVEGEGELVADSSRLQNLFQSAITFARYNEATELVVSLTDDGFTITDDGTHPGEENFDKLFDYGHAVPNAEAGMALPNVETLAEVQGWTVDVDPAYDAGIRIRIGGVHVDQSDPVTG